MPQNGAEIPSSDISDTVTRKHTSAPVENAPENPATKAFFSGVSMAIPARAAMNDAGMASMNPTKAGENNPTVMAPSAVTIAAA